MGTTTWSKTFQGKQAVSTDLFRPLFAQMVEERTFSAHRFIADGEYVVVEGRGYMTTKKGQPYNNCYCWIYRISDGKMKEITEYLDTQLVASVLDPLTEA
jgi:ketosteroid isomerase-like protein